MPDEKPTQAADTVSDPDEDDLSDLDDVLDEFAATKLDTDTTATAPGPSGPGRPSQPAASTAPSLPTTTIPEEDDDFAKQLQAGMADLLGELDLNPEMKKQFEDMMASLASAAESSNTSLPGATLDPSTLPAPASAAPASSSSLPAALPQPTTSKPGEESFQDTIRRTMERMQASGESASAAAASSSSSDDILAQMLREMEAGGFEGLGGSADGGGSDEDFSKMLMGMMEQLTNKEVLYEPMRELRDKFPAWLAANREKVGREDLARYEEQQRLVGEIAGKFEERDYSDESAAHRQFIVDRMEKMQAAGAPPPDLVGDTNAAQEAMGEIEAGCPQQ